MLYDIDQQGNDPVTINTPELLSKMPKASPVVPRRAILLKGGIENVVF